jgi:hypothetical protein
MLSLPLESIASAGIAGTSSVLPDPSYEILSHCARLFRRKAA